MEPVGTIMCGKCQRPTEEYQCQHEFRGRACGSTTRYVALYWSGTHYRFRYYVDGSKLTLPTALTILGQIRAEIWLAKTHPEAHTFDPGKYDQIRRLEDRFGPTWDQWVVDKESLLVHEKIAPNTIKSYIVCGRKLKQYFKERSVQSITAGDLEKLLCGWLYDHGTRKFSSALTYRIVLSSFLNSCRKSGKIAKVPEFPESQRIVGDDSRPTRILAVEDQRRILDALPLCYRDVIEFMMCVPRRPAEVCAMKVSDVDLTVDLWTVQRTWSGGVLRGKTKTSGRRKKPLPDVHLLSDRARQIVERNTQGKLPDAFVFSVNGRPVRPNHLTRVWHRLSPEITMYEGTKHSLVSDLYHQGVEPELLSRWIGHASFGTTKAYLDKLAVPDLRAAQAGRDKGLGKVVEITTIRTASVRGSTK